MQIHTLTMADKKGYADPGITRLFDAIVQERVRLKRTAEASEESDGDSPFDCHC